MGSLEGQTVVITGGGRGQGRSHAVALAREGANIVVTDIGEAEVRNVSYGLATEEDLAETVRQVEALDRRGVAVKADVRNTEDMQRVADTAMAEFGRIDILLANAGIHGIFQNTYTIDDASWQTMIDTNLTGVFKSIRAVVPHMIEGGRGGSIVITSSVDGLRATPSWGHYGAAKAGTVNLMKTLAVELAPHKIRVNTVHPTGVNTPMAEALMDTVGPITDQWRYATDRANLLDVPVIEPEDISNAIAWLVSDKARYVTGVSLPVDAGYTTKH
ncbi:mycofactocin-coupled SDR family oxidoreductase [Agromyces sp. Marseille-P2726]|uniref:mycofactocin-coupled SDR family oxidoreductase n=1 Tax=Agromyces sp. Marseille-P2726 TaxID=2709132 RepID=UPI00156E7F81|nr:mycofactocin-coupled SDR family oxidoreductase [Agromyces sp. Marseille-P2726]